MAWSSLALAFYTLICLIFLDNTYREGEAAGDRWDIMRAAGLALCLVWPVVLVTIFVSAYRGRQAG